MTQRVAPVVVMLAVGWTSPALAQGDVSTAEHRAVGERAEDTDSVDDDARAIEQAREWFEKGRAAYDAGDYAAAARAFEESYRLLERPALLFNIAQALRLAEQCERAVEYYRRYRDGNPGELPSDFDELLTSAQRCADANRPAQNAQAEARASSGEPAGPSKDRGSVPVESEASSPWGSIRIDCDEPDVHVQIDGLTIERQRLTAPIPLRAGAHAVRLRGPNADQLLAIRVAPNAVTEVPCFTSKRSDSFVVQAHGDRSSLDTDDSSSRFPWRTMGFATGGVGLALGGAALAHYLWNKGRHDAWLAEDRALSSEPLPADYRQRQVDNNELAASLERASAVTVGLTVGAAALVSGGVLLVLTQGERQGPRTAGSERLVVGPGHASWSYAW